MTSAMGAAGGGRRPAAGRVRTSSEQQDFGKPESAASAARRCAPRGNDVFAQTGRAHFLSTAPSAETGPTPASSCGATAPAGDPRPFAAQTRVPHSLVNHRLMPDARHPPPAVPHNTALVASRPSTPRGCAKSPQTNAPAHCPRHAPHTVPCAPPGDRECDTTPPITTRSLRRTASTSKSSCGMASETG